MAEAGAAGAAVPVTPVALAAATSTILWGWEERRSDAVEQARQVPMPDIIVLGSLLDGRSQSADGFDHSVPPGGPG